MRLPLFFTRWWFGITRAHRTAIAPALFVVLVTGSPHISQAATANSSHLPLESPTLPTPLYLEKPDAMAMTVCDDDGDALSDSGESAENENQYLCYSEEDPSVGLSQLLEGDLSRPGGNIELATGISDLDNESYENIGYSQCVKGQAGGKSLKICTLTAKDWDSDFDENGRTLLEDASNRYISNHRNETFAKIPGVLDSSMLTFKVLGGRQKFSGGVHISYVYLDADLGQFKIGLASHFDPHSVIKKKLNLAPSIQEMVPTTTPVSKLVKVVIDGKTSYHVSFKANPSGQSSEDGSDLDGTYEIPVPLCSCEGPRGSIASEPWQNHGEYVDCVTQTTNQFMKQGLISGKRKGEIVSEAAKSSCGKVQTRI